MKAAVTYGRYFLVNLYYLPFEVDPDRNQASIRASTSPKNRKNTNTMNTRTFSKNKADIDH